MEKRREVECKVCGKKRMLSKEEADEDGWVIDIKKGLTCNGCKQKYGIPTTFLKTPKFIGICETEDGTGTILEY